MSLKADWGPADERLFSRLKELAVRKGYHLKRAGQQWKLVVADKPRAKPVATGLTLEEVAAILGSVPG